MPPCHNLQTLALKNLTKIANIFITYLLIPVFYVKKCCTKRNIEYFKNRVGRETKIF